MERDDSLFDFPCRFPIKAMGRADGNLGQIVREAVEPHVEGLSESDISLNRSRKGNYIAVTVTVTATSREQLDDIYRALSAHDAILMTL